MSPALARAKEQGVPSRSVQYVLRSVRQMLKNCKASDEVKAAFGDVIASHYPDLGGGR